jgi:hypothetical protein
MPYYSRFYRQPNLPTQEKPVKESFFAKQHKRNGEQHNTPFFQAKLSVNAPGDAYEKEADTVANVVVNDTSNAPVVQQKSTAPEKEKKKISKKESGINEEEKKKKIMPVQTKPNALPTPASPQLSSRIENPSSGHALPQKTINEMSTSFGVDFSGVKVHHDSEAINMNEELQAQAFTHGNDIYFNRGKYNPENKEGKFLLAHELTHVVQQQGSVQKKKVQRSFWGTLGGIVTGVVGGFLVGGPVGAVVGGVAGGVAGDAATTHTRGLNKEEKQEAQKVFGNSLNYNAVSVSDSSELMQIGGYARTPGNTVYFPTGTLGRKDPAYYAFLVHELTHTWQSQHGVSVLTKIRYSLSQSNYDFGGDAGIQQAIKDGKCFNDFNTEAQASIMERYYEILTGQKAGDGLLYYHFVSQVQNYGGKCEPAGIKNDALDPKYRTAGSQSESFA